MATFRVGVGSFNIKDGAVGFGTDTDGLGNLRVKGVTKTTGSIVSGASTLTRYSGFAADNINQLENITLTSEVGTIGDIVVGVGTSVIISSASTVTVGTVESVSIGTHFSPPTGGIEERGQDFVEGMMRFNTDLNTMEFYNGNEWRQFNYQSDIRNSPGSRGRAVHGGGADPSPSSYTNFMSVIEMATQGNATDFGSLLKAGQGHDGFSSSTRGFFTGRKTPSANPDDDIEYFTIASGGQTIFFGNLTSARRLAGTFSSSTRGMVAGGLSPSYLNIIDYVEISTLGDALDFGDTMSTEALNAGCSSPTKGIFNSGRVTSPSTVWESRVEEVTIASKGNSVKFGDLTVAPAAGASFSNSVRGFFAGGHTNPNYNAIDPAPVDSISLSSGGNAVRFGDLSSKRTSTTGTASQTRGFVLGGYYDGSISNVIEFMTLATAGSIQDFGDLVNKLESGGSLSDSHGGLGGY